MHRVQLCQLNLWKGRLQGRSIGSGLSLLVSDQDFFPGQQVWQHRLGLLQQWELPHWFTCTQQRWYTNKVDPLDLLTASFLECQTPDGYSRRSDGFHYLVSQEKMVFQEAQDFCRQHYGNLVITFGRKQIDLLENETIVSDDVWLHPASKQNHNPNFSLTYDQRVWYSIEKKKIKFTNKKDQDEQIQMKMAICQSVCLYELPGGETLRILKKIK